MFNYDEIGEKIKGLAKWVAIVEAILFVISGLVMLASGYTALIISGLITIILGPIIAWVSSWLLYGFGEIVSSAILYQNRTEREIQKRTTNYLSKGSSSVSKKATPDNCSFCGNALPANASYCEKCGGTVTRNTTSAKHTPAAQPFAFRPQSPAPTISSAKQGKPYKACPHCGETVTSNVCGMCGKTNNLFD